MANDLNQCTFVGRLGRDPELRAFPDGGAVTNVALAVGKTWTDKASGQKQERTTWVPVVFRNKLAEVAAQYLRKGAQILVVGEFHTRKWQDQSGQDRYTSEIVANTMQMLGSRQDGEQRQSGQQAQRSAPEQHRAPPDRSREPNGQARSAPSPQPANYGSGFDDMDNDIPF